MSEYQYKPLADQSIRIFQLLPGESNDPLKGCIEHCLFLHSRHRGDQPGRWIPIYEALSYAWGEQDELEIVTIVDDSAEKGSFLRIGKNLASALRDLRSTSEPRTIWCDAICINQEDLPERAAQVRHMADIYRHADRVVVWLAPDSEQVARALHILDEFGSRIAYDLRDVEIHDDEELVYFKKDYLLPFSTHDWQCIVDFVSLPWFMRLWVRQEISLANDSAVLTSGRRQILWSSFCSAMKFFNRMLKLGKTVVNAAERPSTTVITKQMADLVECKCIKYSAFYMVALLLECQCADSRDRIYGTLGLQKTINMRIDYSQTVEEVYIDWIREYYKQYSRLQFLELCEMARRPSWVPNLAKSVRMRLTYAQSRSAADTKAVLEISTDQSCKMLATRYGAVLQHTSAMPQEPDLEVTENTLNSWACQVLPLRDTQSNRELAINNLAATVSCGRTVESFDKGKFNISDVKNVLLRGTEEALPSNTKLDLLTPALFFDLCRLLPHAVVFATDDVHFGLSSSAALVGDEIWVVLGFRFPLLIRPVEDSKYRVVGPCYVPQLSNGEAVLGPLPDGWKVMFHPSGSPHFVAPDGSGTIQDPRLEKELPPGWEQKESPDHSQLLWKRTEDENWRTLDPRQTPEKLEDRGVKLEMITVV